MRRVTREEARRKRMLWERYRRVRGNVSLIKCMVCGDSLQVITANHLKCHGMSTYEYKKSFPGQPMVNKETLISRGSSSAKRALWRTYGGEEPDDNLFSFLTGSILGDGSIEHNKKQSRYAEGGSNEAYLKWKHSFISKYFPCRIKERLSAPHVRSGKRYRGWWVRTASHPLLTEWRRKWYRDVKIVPADIVDRYLNDFALAVWFCDDGHREQSGSMLYTHSFLPKEVIYLKGLINRRFGINSTILKANESQTYIRISANSATILDRILNRHKIPGMEYKTIHHHANQMTLFEEHGEFL